MILLCSLLLAAATTWSQGAPARQGLIIEPATLAFALKAGQSQTQTIRISNGLNVRQSFNVYLSDWLRDTLGNHSYVAPGSLSRTCSPFMATDKTFFELEPGQSSVVNVTMRIPDTATTEQMRWSMVFIETVAEKKTPKADEKVLLYQQMRMGIHVYQTPATLSSREVRMQGLDYEPKNQNRLRITCQNTGEVMIRCKSTVELVSMTDGKKVQIDPVDFPMFPEQRRYVDFYIPAKLPKGKYSVVAAVDAGSDVPLEAAQKIIEII